MARHAIRSVSTYRSQASPIALSPSTRRGQTPLILMDGTDLMPILEGRTELSEVLERKRRHAAETGSPMYRA